MIQKVTLFALRNLGVPALESIPVVGPYVIKPTRHGVEAIAAVGMLAITLLSTSFLLITAACRLATASIRVLSSATSGLFHLFFVSKKST